MVPVSELWWSRNAQLWDKALERYWDFVLPANKSLERELEGLDHQRLHAFDEHGWYAFLLNEYFRWKYTAPNRYATTTAHLKRYARENTLHELFEIKVRLLTLDPSDIATGLAIATEIKGLGTAGASGLLSLIYPDAFGTVDQFVVKALREVPDLPESAILKDMNPTTLTIPDGVRLIRLMKAKSVDNNDCFQTSDWTPRKIDKVLWTYGR